MTRVKPFLAVRMVLQRPDRTRHFCGDFPVTVEQAMVMIWRTLLLSHRRRP